MFFLNHIRRCNSTRMGLKSVCIHIEFFFFLKFKNLFQLYFRYKHMINSLLYAFRFANMTQDLPVRSMNYTKIDQCQVNQCFHNDEFYRQLSIEHVQYEQEYQLFRLCCLTNRLHLIVFLILICFSHTTNALPIYHQNSQVTVQTPYRTYQRYPTQQLNNNNLNSIPSYSNGAYVQIYNPQSAIFMHNSNQLQIRRERQRRAMIDRLVVLFDEDGWCLKIAHIRILSSFFRLGNGQLTKEELYSMAIRSNTFPKFHQFLKQTF